MTKRGLILLVEDDLEDIELTLAGLAAAGFSRTIAVRRDGVEALEYLEDASPRCPTPAAILVDIKMPRMNGLELVEKLKDDSRFRAIPIAFLTSSDHPADVKKAKALGAKLYLKKPADVGLYKDIARQVDAMIESASS